MKITSLEKRVKDHFVFKCIYKYAVNTYKKCYLYSVHFLSFSTPG